MSRVFIGVGSNEGDRLAHISQALRRLQATSGVRVIQMATICETAPIGGPPQGPYLNTVVELETDIPPHQLLPVLQAVEQQLGRKPSTERWGPRPIDLDVLLYDEQVIKTPELTIPHPRMHERRFVLEPLMQLAPQLLHPVLKRSIAELFAQTVPLGPVELSDATEEDASRP